jgi:hypothetical protein
MADTTAAQPKDTPNLQLDEITGEMVSKSEMKKRQKKREQERKKVSVKAIWIQWSCAYYIDSGRKGICCTGCYKEGRGRGRKIE